MVPSTRAATYCPDNRSDYSRCPVRLALIKRKAIGAFTGGLWKATVARFWSFVHSQLQKVAPHSARVAPANERTYRGKFCGCRQFENYPHEHYFELIDGSTTIKVPVMRTNLFSGVQTGVLVQVDTLTGVNYYAEVVQRVRVLEQ